MATTWSHPAPESQRPDCGNLPAILSGRQSQRSGDEFAVDTVTRVSYEYWQFANVQAVCSFYVHVIGGMITAVLDYKMQILFKYE